MHADTCALEASRSHASLEGWHTKYVQWGELALHDESHLGEGVGVAARKLKHLRRKLVIGVCSAL